MWKSRRAFGPRITIAVYWESSHTTLFPTGGSNEPRFSSIQCHTFFGTRGNTIASRGRSRRGQYKAPLRRSGQRLKLLVELGQALTEARQLSPLAVDDVRAGLLDEAGPPE